MKNVATIKVLTIKQVRGGLKTDIKAGRPGRVK